ncbi:MAG TPA: hypothetical protein VJR27_02830 [Candidatus Saccharimonadales bacterium]|nr:hypothetical protein [Candidatus Saccharimonadales bacterium]
MFVFIHVSIALGSLAFATYLLVRPSRRKFAVNYALIAATLGSGIYLVVTTGASLLQTCTSGLAYLLMVTMCTALAHIRAHRDTTD